MKTINITSPKLAESFLQLQSEFGGTISKKLKELVLEVDNDLGFGTIRGTRLKGGLSFLQFNITFNDDIKILLNTPKKSLVNFAYCSEGKMAHSFSTKDNRVELETFQTGILSNITQDKNVLYFDKDIKTSASMISVNVITEFSEKHVINRRIKNLFVTEKTTDFVHVGSYNLKIAEQMKTLQGIKQNGVVRTLLIEGLVNIILALEIEQHKQDLKRIEANTGTLTSNEMVEVKELSDYINNFPETSLTVTELAHKIGLTPSKLQEGFKLMHGRTVNDYIREVRVTKSEVLIKTTDMNISQILYTLGFSSRSYFSKIFKEKYNCSPSQYKSQNKLAATA